MAKNTIDFLKICNSKPNLQRGDQKSYAMGL